ncbi:oligopeptide transport system ATP-binding protein [Arboricoccus pini]|uniref:Oligopeptide transport system ATP-binding protein n=1 Tax=Arboricoccus pini TaxID=1963835 RepID=A0A212R8Z9_9PROT|nr:ABC transporter ATP-binding protein [Arboricoccus pini]SNB68681.1 oligopeptide transport system ATP-binding protein [Arboricoccus pini]
MTALLFELLDVEKSYELRGGGAAFRPGPKRRLRALDGVRLTVARGDSVALVGESGSGKSTLLRVLMGLTSPTDGRALYGGQDVTQLKGERRAAFQREVAMVYQDARGSLNPRLPVLDLIAEPIRHHKLRAGPAVRDRVLELLDQVGLPAATLKRYPSQLSGGQVRRVAIARALASEPLTIVADEAVSGLDVSTQAQLLNLLVELQRRMGLTLIFITHDLGVASFLCDQIAVMYLGRIVETGPTRAILERPAHPYTQALLNAQPRFFAPIAQPLQGEIPSPIDLPPGCRFAGRCPRAVPACREDDPALMPSGQGRAVACIRPLTAAA